MDIGLEIKILRERAKMSSKELAEKIGLSQSQMSRLEKGQRRIEAELLNKIASILNVSPTYFFEKNLTSVPPYHGTPGDSFAPPAEIGDPEVSVQKVNLNIGKIIRSERRKKHITAEELGEKIGRNKPYIYAIEEGQIDLLNEDVIQKICKVLRLDSLEFFSAQQSTIHSLKKQILRLSQAYSESTRGNLEISASSGETFLRRGIPIIENSSEGYPKEFSPEGFPLGEVEEYVFIPGIKDPLSFALFVSGDSMEQRESPSFLEGDIVVFSPQEEVLGRDYIFVRPREGESLFQQVFFDQGGQIRLQPLNRNHSPTILLKTDIVGWWKMVAHVHRI